MKDFIANNHNYERNMLCQCGSTFGFTLVLSFSLHSSWVSEAAAVVSRTCHKKESEYSLSSLQCPAKAVGLLLSH